MFEGGGKKTLKYLGYGVIAVLVFVLQSSRLINVRLFSATAELMPFLVAALAVYEGPYVAGITGFFAGLLSSLHSASIEGLDSLFLSLFGVLFAFIAATYFREGLLLCVTGGAVGLFVTELLKYAFYYLLADGVGPWVGLLYIAGRVLVSLPGGLIVALVIRRVSQGIDGVNG
ncbi:MAG: hypothetical protein IJS65_02115 [Clostridia bacterium]|nr:hypothetical protein [Clostridia bacterium]